jgi:hypothetical protein
MRQILIEKYILPNKVLSPVSWVKNELWFNKYGELHSFLGQPSHVRYENANIKLQEWHQNGERHRDRDFPAMIYYNYESMETHNAFYKNGKWIKTLDL